LSDEPRDADESKRLVRRHLLIGWLGLAVFLSLGIALEVFHALKWDFYLDLRNAPRRHLWTLAHTHGTLFSLLSIAFAWTAMQVPWTARLSRASVFLVAALILMPAGFFLGGVTLHGGDPNLAILLVPVGAVFLMFSACLVLVAVRVSPLLRQSPRAPSKDRRNVR
jgi:hypothetical protein